VLLLSVLSTSLFPHRTSLNARCPPPCPVFISAPMSSVATAILPHAPSLQYIISPISSPSPSSGLFFSDLFHQAAHGSPHYASLSSYSAIDTLALSTFHGRHLRHQVPCLKRVGLFQQLRDGITACHRREPMHWRKCHDDSLSSQSTKDSWLPSPFQLPPAAVKYNHLLASEMALSSSRIDSSEPRITQRSDR
jgi:hypothetical protein